MSNPSKQRFQKDRFSHWKTTGVIIGLLIVWATLLALGAVIKTTNVWRPILIFGSLVSFAGFWLYLLLQRKTS